LLETFLHTLQAYIPKRPFRGKYYSKYIIHVTYTIVYRVKLYLERTFWNSNSRVLLL